MKFKLFIPIIIAIIIIGVGIWLIFGTQSKVVENLLTYTNNEYGYSFDYPETWDVTQCLKTVIIAPQETVDLITENNCVMETPKGYVWGINYKSQEEFDDIINPYRISDSYKDVTKEDVTINGMDVIKYTSDFKKITSHANPGDKFIDILFPIQGGYIESTFMDQEYIDTYEEILNTFRF